jgi:putative protease
VRAAIENGADAIYFGLDCGFNARARAHNFHPDELPGLMQTLHRRGVRGYVTLNTLVFSDELARIESLVRQIAMAGTDAVLVQDLGLVRLVRAICPDLPIHASTQMTMTSSQTIEAARSLGIERVVLARELSLKEIRRIRRETDLPLEVFVHGALCVAYSGQCLTSESLGGRSANRGQCAQACRLPYDLICDGKEVETGTQKYLLSPQDLAAYALVPELIEAGVCSLKIEGRLKTPEYVANITRHYRQAIDEAMAGRPVQFAPRQVEEMELSFSRGFSPGWLNGDDHKMLVPATSGSKRGVLLGQVREVRRGRVLLELSGSVKRGDGVAFDCGKPVDDEQGGRVYEVFVRGKSIAEAVDRGVVELTFAHESLDWRQIWPGQQVWKTDDPALTARLRKSYAGDVPQRRLPVSLQVEAEVGQPLRIHASAGDVSFSIASPNPLGEARQHALSEETLREQLGRLGGTAYELRELSAHIIGRPMAPFSVLGKLRHELVARLEAVLAAAPVRRIASESSLSALRPHEAIDHRAEALHDIQSVLTVLCRSLGQLREVLALDVETVYIDFQDIREYREAVKLAREADAAIFLATPRIQKPDEAGLFQALAKYLNNGSNEEPQRASGMLVRNLAGLEFCRERGIPYVIDFSLNCANELTAQWLHEKQPLRITPSYDLNRDQLLDLIANVPAQWLEIVVHQHMPMFHMEHCVFCAMLSPGTNKTNCGRPCDRHDVQLRDRQGIAHPLKADVGCRNTLFNAVPQSGAEIVPALLARGVRYFRVELLDQRGREIEQTLALYQRLLSGEVTGKEVWSQLKATNRVGVTRGTLDEKRDPLAIL